MKEASSRMRMVLKASLTLALVSFLWSFLGFLSPTSSRFEEYTSPAIFQEIAGHVFFGLLVGVFFFDLSLAFVCGAGSILIDVDHILPALGFPVLARMTHSMIFAVAAGLILAYFMSSSQKRALFFVASVASVVAHLSYDVFAGDGVFPLLAPLVYNLYSFPYWSWLPIEVAAILLVLVTAVKTR